MRGAYIGWICLLLACGKPSRPTFPVIQLNIPVNSIPEEDKKNCTAILSNASEAIRIKASIEYRGSASRKFPKRSFTLHLRNKEKEPLKWNGLTLQGDWVLYGPYADRSCIRNKLALDLFQQLGHYSPKSVFAELLIDTAYMGLYEWREKIALQSDRVTDVPFLLKFDKDSGKKGKMISSKISPLVPIRFHDSLPGNRIDEAFTAVFNFENALLKGNREWERYADKNSFVDYFLFTELANSPDAYRSSCYFQVLPDGRLRMGPVWDFDLAFGNSNLFLADEIPGWRFKYNEADSFKQLAAPRWWSNLYNRTDFRESLKNRWERLRKGIFSDAAIAARIDRWVKEIGAVVGKNHTRWQVMSRSIFWTIPAQESYEAEIQKLKSWIGLRAAWMDQQLKEAD